MREKMGCCVKWEVQSWVFFTGLVVVFTASFSGGLTDSRDVMAMNNLYISLGYPPLQGWILVGGDPCGEAWQGVECVFSNITAIKLSGVNLGGELGDSLQFLGSVMHLDFSNNHIGGIIPSALPPTLTNLSLSGNLLNGNIPDTLSTLSQLLELSLDNNHLVGPIPDSFLQFTSLTRLDLSSNNLSGQLPPSMGSLVSLSTLHLQNNQLVGMLDVLQDLPLQELDIGNNLFSGPIPVKLLIVPILRKDGNPFNTTIILTPLGAPTLSPMWAPSPDESPWTRVNGPPNQITVTPGGGEAKKPFPAKTIIWIGIAGISIVIVLLLCLLLPRFFRRRRRDSHSNPNYSTAHESSREQSKYDKPSSVETGVAKPVVRSQERPVVDDRRAGFPLKPLDGRVMHVRSGHSSISMKDNEIDMTDTDDDILPPPPLPFSVDSVTVNPIAPTSAASSRRPSKLPSLNSLRAFTVASLQQYTNSFSRENLLGTGMFGSVYSAELPGGELLEVKKLDTTVFRQLTDDEFLELVSNISKLRHTNIAELVGYCLEHGQRLLVYKCCINGTLHDGLHAYDEVHQQLSWNRRIEVALGAARALVYMHEVCKPPVVHGNFKSSNLLLDDALELRVSDCGLAPFLSPASARQISQILNAHGYGAPEFESGVYTYQSDVYSFGVVLLELLTGRKAYDSSRPRSEQFLVRWAIPKLHDIDALSRMVDHSLYGAYSMKSLSRFADIISSCLQREPEFRPPISEIVQELQQVV